MIFLLIAVANIHLENAKFLNELHELQDSATQFIQGILNTPTAISGLTLLVWMIIGLIVFSLSWALIVILMDIRNDFVVSEYFVHPNSFHKSNYWFAVMSRAILTVTVYAVIFLYVFLLLRSVPIMYSSLRTLIGEGLEGFAISALSALLALGSWLLGWHLIAVVWRFGILLNREIKG